MFDLEIKDVPYKGEDIKSMEHTTLKVPYEFLNKKYRASQKLVDKEFCQISQSLKELKNSRSLSEVQKAFDNVVGNLKDVKRKADESIAGEQEAAQACKRRLDHLKGAIIDPSNQLAIDSWKRKRLDRYLVDHLLRNGYQDSASKLTKRSGLDDMANLELFDLAKRVETSLTNHETKLCLSWCIDNKSRLKKMKSTLELKLRQQEFIELIRQDQRLAAINHARKYLSNLDGQNDQSKELERIMGLLVHPVDTLKEPYRTLLDISRWDDLIEQFKQENFRSYHLNSVSIFSVVLQAGLSALKSPYCYRKSGHRNLQCPTCTPPLNELSRKLPYPHITQSKLICSISGQLMDDNNPPMMLPNGQVYSQMSLKSVASCNNGRIRCPKTHDEFSIDELERVFVM